MGKRLIKLGLILLLGLVGCAGTISHDVVLKVFSRARSQITYKDEPGKQDYWQTPDETRRLGTGDCEDITLYLQDELKKEGVKTKEVGGVIDLTPLLAGRKGIQHMWLEYKEGNDVYILDPTNDIIIRRRSLPIFLYREVPYKNMKEKLREYNERFKNGAENK